MPSKVFYVIVTTLQFDVFYRSLLVCAVNGIGTNVKGSCVCNNVLQSV